MRFRIIGNIFLFREKKEKICFIIHDNDMSVIFGQIELGCLIKGGTYLLVFFLRDPVPRKTACFQAVVLAFVETVSPSLVVIQISIREIQSCEMTAVDHLHMRKIRIGAVQASQLLVVCPIGEVYGFAVTRHE